MRAESDQLQQDRAFGGAKGHSRNSTSFGTEFQMTLPAWRPGSDSITSCPLSLPEAGSKQGRPCVLRSPPSCLSSYPILGRLGKQKKKKVLLCMWRVTLVVAWAL